MVRKTAVFAIVIGLSCGLTWAGDGGFNGLPIGIDLPNTSDVDYGYVRIADDDALEPQTLTIEAWIQPLGIGYGQTHAVGASLVGKPMEGVAGSNLGSWGMFWSPDDDGEIVVVVNDELGVSGTAMWSIGTVPMGTSAHVAMTFDGTWLRVFIDGQLDNEVQTATAVVDYADQDILIGASNFGSGYLYRYDGIIDEVRIWDYARDAAEIAGQMDCALDGTEPGLLAYYSFNMGDATDTSGQGHDGVIEGTADYLDFSQDCMIHFDGFDDGTALAWD